MKTFLQKSLWIVLISTMIIGLNKNVLGQETSNLSEAWEELDARPIPTWFEDAKFGIFIHWGLYSVPAWSPKGTYSEWYQYWLQTGSIFGNGDFTGQEIPEFQRKTYGKESTYYDFAEMFKADLFDAKEWASLFEKSGAKYIVITSKHHDGFCLWPSKEANDRGFAWNSKEVGAKKDLLGLLSEEVKKTDVKMGMYYSLYEWFHPWWQNDRERFVDEHFHPQFKDLVERYQPDILWADGEWAMTSDKWKTPELISWLYKESSVKDHVIINDRWGQETRHHHGGYYTTEYESEADFDKPWEECRGMGFSFGYNRNEDIEDYNSAKAMILMLCDLVSNGGNLLLDIGPDGRGRIPVIMQERLLQIGEWLEVNGDAIYGSRKWREAVQWSEGERDCKDGDEHYVGGDYILKQTIDPIGPGCAVKEVFFTYKNGNLFAITPQWPGEKLILKNIQVSGKTKITFLDSNQDLNFKVVNGNVEIELPSYSPNDIKTDLAFAFKLTHIQEYAKNPKLKMNYQGFSKPVEVEISASNLAEIFYTLDGSKPSKNSKKYSKPFDLKKDATVKCMSFEEGKWVSNIISENIKVYDEVKDIKLNNQVSDRYAANGVVSLMDHRIGSTDHNDGKWLGFEKKGVEIIIDFGKTRVFNEVDMGFLQSQGAWIFLPQKISFSVSRNGKDFDTISSKEFESTEEAKKSREVLSQSFNSIHSRYLKIEIENLKSIPEWHKGAGYEAWIFMDEIEIK